MPTNLYGVSTGPRITTFPHRQERRERAAARLVAALAPDSKHRFGSKKRHGLTEDGEVAYTPEGEAAARAEAEFCLSRLTGKGV